MKIKYILAAITLAIGVSSCTKDEIMYYEGVDKIYFTYAYANDSLIQPHALAVLFAYTKTPVQDSIVSIEVATLGHTSPHERFFALGVVDTLTTATLNEDYELLPSSIPANQVKGYARVKIKNTQKLKEGGIKLTVRLEDNENFTTGVKFFSGREGLNFRINFDDIRTKPLAWVYYGGYFKPYFGDYSQVKYETILKVCGFDNNYFEFDNSDKTVFGQRFPMPALLAWMSMVNRYLMSYKEQNGGKDLLDENGNKVLMGQSYN